MTRAYRVTFEAGEEVYDVQYYTASNAKAVCTRLAEEGVFPPKLSKVVIEVIHLKATP